MADLPSWNEVVNAQVLTGKRHEEQEQQARRMNKVLYKRELDHQLQAKTELARPDYEEQAFFLAQNKVMAQVDQQRREEARQKQRTLARDYEREQRLKNSQLQASREVEKQYENKYILNQQALEQQERRQEQQKKQDLVDTQRKELQQLLLEKRAKHQQELAEKEHDKQMILENIQKMAASENHFKEFYEDRLARRQAKFAAYRPVPFTNRRAESLLRSTDEYNRRKDAEYMQQQTEAECRRKNELDSLKHVLSQQVKDKINARRHKSLDEWREYRKAHEITQREIQEDQRELLRRRRLQSELQQGLKHQVEEKQRLQARHAEMDERERQIHNGLLHKIHSEGAVGFPGVPGIHSAESPAQQQLHKVFARRPSQQVYRYMEHSGAASQRLRLGQRLLAVDMKKHDPIINPIGSSPPVPRSRKNVSMYLF